MPIAPSEPTRPVSFRLHVEHLDAVDQRLVARRVQAPWLSRADLLRELLVLALEASPIPGPR